MLPTRHLAGFASGLTYQDIPESVRERAVDGILDTVGACQFGANLPWSKIVIAHAVAAGGGSCSILGTQHKVSASLAALANGTLAHGCEIDNLRQPSVGVHPGAVLVPAVFAIGEEIGASGRDVIAAYVAGFEVMARIGMAAHNSAEKLGFHSPGLTGTFGAAIAAGRLLGLDTDQMTNALGIAGSLCSGVLAFSKAGNGGMVKRLHMGRAAEGGVLAARLAQGGFEGPDVILEGGFGFFDCFSRDPYMDRLTAELGAQWEVLNTCFKCYAAHVTAHTPIQALEALRVAEPFQAADVAKIHLATSDKVLSHHASITPKDVASAQYSVPICLATALYRNPNDPWSFLDSPHTNAAILELAARISLTLNPAIAVTGSDWATRLTVVCRNGREITIERNDFTGAPSNPMSRDILKAKYDHLSYLGNAIKIEELIILPKITDIKTLFT